MANSGGGVLVFGVAEVQKLAIKRVDAGACDETYERAMRSAAFTAISPPVFGLDIHRLQDGENRAVVVVVPGSLDGPHLIYRNDYFGAPIRNDSDTVWMKERQIEAMYRARFTERQLAVEALDDLYAQTARGRDFDKRAWLIATAHPRIPRVRDRLTADQAQEALSTAASLGLSYARQVEQSPYEMPNMAPNSVDEPPVRPLKGTEKYRLHPGLRRWVAVNNTFGDPAWKQPCLSIHDDGSVTLAIAVGRHHISTVEQFRGWRVRSTTIETAVADFMGLLRATALRTHDDEYDLRVGIEWTGTEPLILTTSDEVGLQHDRASMRIPSYVAVDMTVNAAEPDVDYRGSVHALAQDCINQGGISFLSLIRPPDRDVSKPES